MAVLHFRNLLRGLRSVLHFQKLAAGSWTWTHSFLSSSTSGGVSVSARIKLGRQRQSVRNLKCKEGMGWGRLKTEDLALPAREL
jgi:hypothetical protein